MKAYKKSELEVVNGILMTRDMEVVAVDPAVVRNVNALETFLQKAEYVSEQPKAQAAPSLEGFERRTTARKYEVKVETPLTDKAVEDGVALMRELSQASDARKVNSILESFRPALDFFDNDYIVEVTRFDAPAFDTPLIDDAFGGILVVKPQSVIAAVTHYCEVADMIA